MYENNYNAVDLLQELGKIESTNPGKYEIEIAEYIIRILKANGIETIREEVADGRFNIMAIISAEINNKNKDNIKSKTNSGNINLDNQYNIINTDNFELIFIAHMDTVTVANNWSYDPYAMYKDNDRIYGLGACDMKGGLSCMLSTFIKINKAVKEKKLVLKRNIKLICTVDEEADMRGVERAIESGWITKNSMVLDGEPTNGKIRIAHKGRLWFHIEAYGVSAHASIPEKGADAVLSMARFITTLKTEIEQLPQDEELGKTTVVFGKISGGKEPYIVPDYCETYIDIRNTPPNDVDVIINIINKIIESLVNEYNGLRIHYEITGQRPYIKKNNKSSILKQLQNAIKKSILINPQIDIFTGYTDTAVIAGRLNNINCASYGPGNLEMAHKPDEFVLISDLERCEKVYYELCCQNCF